MSRWRALASLAWVGVVLCGCLPAFAPNLRPREAHAGVSADGGADACMSCHVAEAEAIALEGPAPAPIVADWMLEEARACVDCHRVREPREHAGLPDDRLPKLAEVDDVR